MEAMHKMGHGILRLSFELAHEVLPEARLSETTLQRELHDIGFFGEMKQRLLLPESYEIVAIYVEPYQLCWVLLLRSPDIPCVDEGTLLPHCTPIYTRTDREALPSCTSLVRIEIEPHDRVLRVD